MTREEVTYIAQQLQLGLENIRNFHFTHSHKDKIRDSEKYSLWVIKSAGGKKPIIPSQLAQKLHITLGAVTHHIKALEKQGFIERKISEEDKRVLYLYLTAKGARMVEKFEKEHYDKLKELVHYLGKEESEHLIFLISKLYTFIQSHNNEIS